MAAIPQRATRRGEEVRCPACLRFKPASGPCSSCGCGEVPPERHGAARVLLQAGVDRFSLAQRVAALEPRQAELMEQQYATQWERAWPLLEDVRRCEEHLLQRGFVEDMVDLLAALIPTDPTFLAREVGPPERPETLEALFAKSTSWEVQQLAALALLHQGKLTPDIIYSARSCLTDSRERVRVEAMLAVSRWRVRDWVRIGVKGWEQVREIAQKALAQPELAARAAVAWVKASQGKELEVDVLFALRKGLEHSDPEVRFECALSLEDEAGLLAALDSTDREQVSMARRVLSARGSSRLFERLAREEDADFVRDMVTALPREVPFEALEALLSASERRPDRLTEALLPLIDGRPFAEWSEPARVRWRSWARAVLPEVPGAWALRVLWWAAVPPVTAEEVRPFVEATAQALAREPASGRASNLEDGSFSRFLSLAGPAEDPLLNRWAREEECGAHDAHLAPPGLAAASGAGGARADGGVGRARTAGAAGAAEGGRARVERHRRPGRADRRGVAALP